MTVSVLIPCYNVEDYISECIESVLNQTCKVDEIVLVNDGSTDKTLEILEEFKSKYSNIKLINQKNVGRSETRNILIKNSTSNYFYFLDADDWIENYTIENFKKEIQNNEYDIVVGRAFKNNKKFHIFSNVNKNMTKEEYVTKNATYVWNIFYNKKFWDENNFKFNNEYSWWEDIGLYPYIVIKVKKIGFITTPAYHYRRKIKDLKKQSKLLYNSFQIECMIGQLKYSYYLVNKEFPKKDYPEYVNSNFALSHSTISNAIMCLSKNIPKIKYIKELKKIEKENRKIKYPYSCNWKFWFFVWHKILIFGK